MLVVKLRDTISVCLYHINVCFVFCFFFFFKQKTAYEMRISDWSSDVCSSDLGAVDFLPTEKITDGLDCRVLIIEIGLEMQFHSGLPYRLRTSRMPFWFRIAAILDSATSSAKPESLKTTRVSTAGASSFRHATIPLARVSTVSLDRSEEHTSELPSLMRISYAVFCLKKKKHKSTRNTEHMDHQ